MYKASFMTEIKTNIDAPLVKALKKGDIFAFNELFHKYSQKVYNFSIKHLKNEEDVKDLIQDIFMKIWDKRKEIDEEKSFNGFLFTIALNSIRNHFRKKVKDRRLVNKWFEETETYSDSTNLSVEFKSLEKIVNTFVEQLPPKRRMVFRISLHDGLSNVEIASKMKIRKKTVENHLNLALKYLREKLQTHFFLVILFFVLFY